MIRWPWKKRRTSKSAPSGANLLEVTPPPLTRSYRCPRCGYHGAKMGAPRTNFFDVNIRMGCPCCQTRDGVTVWLEETSDPRSVVELERLRARMADDESEQ